jgi:sn-glycerol 3-phosphate transport system substrate-binding protein
MPHPTPTDRPAPRRGTRLRLLVALALLLTTALVAAACGGDGGDGNGNGNGGEGAARMTEADPSDCPLDALDGAAGPVDVTVWHAYVGLTKTTLEELANRFNASQDRVNVTVEAQGTYEELLKKFEDALGDPSTLPDIIVPEDTTTRFMIDSGAVVPASACIAADAEAEVTYDDVIPAVNAAYTVDGILWPAAFSVSTPVLYVNNSILRQAGVETTSYPQTLEELRDVARRIKAANVPGVTEPMVMKVDSWYIEHWLTGDGKTIVNEENGRTGLATESELEQPTTQELFDWLESMVDEGLLKAIPSTASGIDEYLAINNKTSALLIQTSTAITTVAALLEGSVQPAEIGGVDAPTVDRGLDIGVGLVPGIEAAGKGQIGGSGWYMVQTDQPAEIAGSWEFLQYFLQTPNQVDWTVKASYLPVLKSAQDDPTLQADFTGTTKGRWLAIAYQGLQNLDPAFPGPVIGPYKEFRADVRSALDGVMLTGAPTAPAIEQANQRFQQALDTYAQDVGG